MRMMTSCKLISFRPDAHEVGTDPVETKRKVKCQELGLVLEETYQSGGLGLSPEAKLLIPYDRDYKGERELEYNGERWVVLRTDPYKAWNGVILLIRRKQGNSGDNTPAQTPVVTSAPAEVGSDA